jgi:hypothetical protein
MSSCCSTSRFLKERIMSDTALKNTREHSVAGKGAKAQALGPTGGWRRLKLRLAARGGAVGEVLHDMDEGRRQHPVISAYH